MNGNGTKMEKNVLDNVKVMKITRIEKSLYPSVKKKEMNVKAAFPPEGKKLLIVQHFLCVSDSVALLEHSNEECL